MTALSQICQRAVRLYTAPVQGASLSTATAAVQQLSLFAAALSSLASDTRASSTRSEEVTAAAASCAHQLRDHVAALPLSADVSEKVMSSVLATVKQHRHFLETSLAYELMRETSMRFSTVNLLLWKPKQLLAGLHAIAKSCAGEQVLPITLELVSHIERALSQLNARDTALFLWCLAVLQWFDRNASLWDTVCRRCILLFAQMNHVSRTTVLHAVLLTPAQCESRGQQELMTLLQREQDRASESMQAAQDDTGAGEPGGWDHKGLRLRLLSSVARLPTEVQLALLQRQCRQATSARKEQGDTTLTSPDVEEMAYLFEHLSRKHLSLAHSVTALEVLVETCQVLGPDTVSLLLPGTQRLWKNAVSTAAPLTLSSHSGHHLGTGHDAYMPTMSSPSEESNQRCLELLVTAGLTVPFLLASPAPAASDFSDAPFSVLDNEESKRFCQAAATRLATHVDHWQRELAPPDARSVWTAALAVDFLSATSVSLDTAAPISTIIAAATEAVEKYPALWEARGLAVREGVELLVLGPQTPLAPSWTARNRPNVSAALLSRGLASVAANKKEVGGTGVAQVGVRRVLELCIAVEGGGLTRWLGADATPSSSGVWRRLLQAQQAHTPLLRAITDTIHARTRARSDGRAPLASLNGAGSDHIPDALLDLWIRHLQNDGASPLSSMQEEALLGCFAQRGADPDGLESAFLLLVTRRLGESRTLLETRSLSPSGVVCLVEHACTLSRSHPVTASTILFTLMQRLSAEARKGELSLDALNDIASLLSSPACADRETRETLAIAVKQGAMKLLTTRQWPAESKAFLVAYLVRAEVVLDPPFLAALRSSPSSV